MFKSGSWRCASVTQKSVLHVVFLTAPVCLAVLGCGGSGLLGLLGEFGVSEEELQAYNDAVAEFQDRVENLPSVRVRIVNETNVTARVSFEAGIVGPEPPEPDFFGEVLYGEEAYLSSVDSRIVLVAAGGEAEGMVKCGEVIAISASAPTDRGTYAYDGDAFGLYVDPGNISFAGLGADSDNFTGDTITGTRYVRPAMDSIDCASDTLIIRIESIASANFYDVETGGLVTPGSPGLGSIELE